MKKLRSWLTRALSAPGRLFLVLFLIVSSFQALAQTITWSETLTSGLSPSQAQCTNWTNFLNQLTPGTYSSVRITGTFNPTGVTITDPAAVAQLANLMFTRAAGSVTSGGHVWVVGIGCNGPTACGAATPQVELSVDQPTCNCSSTLSLRPHIGNQHWGGVGTTSCSPPTQTLTIQFQKGSPAGLPRVLLLNAIGDNGMVNDITTKLVNTGSFSAVDAFDGRTATPTLATLMNYNAILIATNSQFSNTTVVGDNLASYVDAGGGVVSMLFATASVPVGGRFNSPTYLVINPQSQTQGSTQLLGQVFQPGHPIMQNVTSFNGGTSSYRGTSNTITPGSVRIANWTDGLPLVAVKELVGPAQVRRADLNFFPASSDSRADFWVSSTHGTILMMNALKWVSGITSASPTITLQPAQQANLCVGQNYTFSFSTTGTFNAGNMFRLELSNSNGSFSSPTLIGQANIPGSINGFIPSGAVPPGSGYRVRITSTNPTVTSNDNGTNLTIHATPTAQITGAPPVICQGGSANVQITLTGAAPWTVDYTLGGINNTFVANSSPASIAVQPTQSTFLNLISVRNAFGCVGGAMGSIPITVYVTPQLSVSNVSLNNSPGECGAQASLDPVVTGTPPPSLSYVLGGNFVTMPYVFPVGTTEVTVYATNDCGTAVSTVTVIVNDIEEPLIVNPPDILANNDPWLCTTEVVLQSPDATDNCEIASIVHDQTDNVYPVGETIVTWTVTDIHGNAVTGTQKVIVTDGEAPQIIGPDVLVHNDPGLCSASVILTTPDATDNCGVASITNDQTGDIFPVGESIVTWTAVDIHGNITTQVQKVIVTDAEAPQMIIGPDVHVNNDPGLCSAVVTLMAPEATDNCSIASIANDQTDDVFPVGVTEVIWTATDIHGNTSTTVQKITVTDVESPLISTTNITVKADPGRCSATFRLEKPRSLSDNCGVASLTNDHHGDEFPVGETIVTWIAADKQGNSSAATQTIIVIDTQIPGIGSSPDILVDNDPGYCSATVELTAPPAKDICGIASVTHDQPDNVFDVGETIVTWTATDVNGLTAISKQRIIVANTAPVIESVSLSASSVPANTPVTLSVSLSDNNVESAIVDWGDLSQSTVSATTGFNLSHTYAMAGDYVILVTITDACGSQAVNGSLTMNVTPVSSANASVTGGGWFTDPYFENHWSNGKHKGQDKGHFAFVAKSGKNHPAPFGEATFKLNSGKLTFTSSSYESLEVDGFKAYLKGKGKVGGVSGYNFLIAVIDGDMIAKKSPDKFRIKIWNNLGDVVYDNQEGAPDNAPASMAIEGGQIIIFEQDDEHADFASSLAQQGADKKGSGEGPVLSAWPNPFTDVLSFKFESSERTPMKVQLIDITGLPVHDQVHEFNEDGVYHFLLKGDQLRIGVYILKVNQGGRVEHTKLLRN